VLRRILFILTVPAMLLASILTATAAQAQSPHFVGTPSCTKPVSSGLTCSGKAAGQGNGPTAAFLAAGSVSATYVCHNHGGQVAPGRPVVNQNPHDYNGRPWMACAAPARDQSGAVPGVGFAGGWSARSPGLAVKSRGAELAVRRFDHDRRTGSDGAPRPLADEGAQGQDVLVSGSGNVTQCSPGWART